MASWYGTILLPLLAITSLASARRFEPKGATVTLHTKWVGTPLVHEAAEFLADEDPALFWRFVEAWGAQGSDAADPPACWGQLVDFAAELLSTKQAEMLRLALNMRQYSPKLELYRQLSESSPPPEATACCWAAVDGRPVSDAAGVAAVLRAAKAQRAKNSAELFPFDHIYQPAALQGAELNASDPSVLSAVLYAPLGSACASDMHAALAKAADEAAVRAGGPKLAYAWRPLLLPGCSGAGACSTLGAQGRLVVPGYGVELAIKNMEYNARDDSKKAEDGDAAPGSTGSDSIEKDGPDEVGGFVFSRLLERKPHLRQELLTFRDSLLAAASQEQVLKVWDLKDLGLQAVQRISAASDPLHLLQEVAHNFPSLVEALSRMAVEGKLRSAVTEFQRMIPAHAPFLLVNGLIYDTSDFNIYALLDVLRRELRVWDALSSAGLPPSAVREALLLRGATNGENDGPVRLDLQSDNFIGWVNDLENDARYARWPTSLENLLMPMYPGRLPSVGRNIFNAIFAFDPSTPAALEIGASVARMYAEGWPLRVGLLPVARSAVDKLRSGRRSAEQGGLADHVVRLVGMVQASYGGLATATFLSDLRSQIPESVDQSPGFNSTLWATAQKVFLQSWSKWGSTFSSGSGRGPQAAALSGVEALEAALQGSGPLGEAAQQFLDGAADLAYAKGIAGMALGSGVLVFNGVIMQNEAGSWRGTTGQIFQMQMQTVQEAVYLGHITDDSEDLYADMLAMHHAVPRYNPRVMPLGERSPRYIRMSGEAEEAQARQLALTGRLCGMFVGFAMSSVIWVGISMTEKVVIEVLGCIMPGKLQDRQA